jgi:hypothetical protein
MSLLGVSRLVKFVGDWGNALLLQTTNYIPG